MTPQFRIPLPLILGVCLWILWGCTPLAKAPVQPSLTEPYAILNFSTAMQLVAIDHQPIQSHPALQTLRVRPGSHTLEFIHVNNAPEGSLDHSGQRAAPFQLKTYAGITYDLEAKT